MAHLPGKSAPTAARGRCLLPMVRVMAVLSLLPVAAGVQGRAISSLSAPDSVELYDIFARPAVGAILSACLLGIVAFQIVSGVLGLVRLRAGGEDTSEY